MRGYFDRDNGNSRAPRFGGPRRRVRIQRRRGYGWLKIWILCLDSRPNYYGNEGSDGNY